jgi:hypothetical protein
MLKKRLFIATLLLISALAQASTVQLTPKAKVIIFTCTKGPELYAGFGHSAIWIVDPEAKVDRLYNYGTFDFDTPNFYTKFVRGKLNYQLSVTTGKRFMAEYEHRQLGVVGQTLNLTLPQMQKTYDYLENNYLPENRFYKYDFFFDNCATRIRDVIYKETDAKVELNLKDPELSFREMLFPYLGHTPWTKFGINMILGLAADKPSSNWDCMYLPERMQDAFNESTIETTEGKQKLVKAETQYLKLAINFTNNKFDDPWAVFGAILLVVIGVTYWGYKKGIALKWLDTVLFTITVLAGLFLLFMWFGTDHSATKQNLNVFWLLPAQLLFLVSRIFKPSTTKLLVSVSLIYQIAIVFAMLVWPQNAELSFFLIAMVYIVRIGSKYVAIKKAIK